MAADTEKFILPSGQEIEKEKETPPDMVLVKTRIEENIGTGITLCAFSASTTFILLNIDWFLRNRWG